MIETGLVAVGDGVYAYLQEDRGLGWSNAGFVARGGGLVVDTLYDVALTSQMARRLAEVHPEPVERVINTHHNGDHCWGNQVFADAEIIAHRGCAERFSDFTPQQAHAMATLADPPDHLAEMVDAFAEFDFSGIELTPPTRVIEGDLSLTLDDTRVDVLHVGPAHTEGDLIVHLPEVGVVFMGDVLFNQCTPIGWEGTYRAWDDALALVEGLEPEVVVPGHGPRCGVDGVAEMRAYLAYVRAESVAAAERGMLPLDAAKAIDLGPWADWTEPHRLAANVHRAYREHRGSAWDDSYDAAAVMADVEALRRHYEDA